MHPEPFLQGFSNLATCRSGPPVGNSLSAAVTLISRFNLDSDVSSLFPYINAVAEKAVFYEKPVFIKFMFDGCLCALYPDKGAAAPFKDYRHANDFMHRLVAFLNRIHRKRKSIDPNHKKFRKVNVLDILRLLPRNNCRECGFATCMAFAAALSTQRTTPETCPKLSRPISMSAEYPVYDDEGNLLSTVSIDIDTSKTKRDLDAKNQQIERLNKRISEISKPTETAVDDANGLLPSPLTIREIEVLRLLAHGATNKEISDLLCISPHTSKSHVTNIFNKLGVNDRTQAAVWATRNNMV